MVPLFVKAGAAIVAVSLLGYGLMRRRKKAATSPDTDARSKALKKASDDGFAEGKADGIADSGKAHNPRPMINYSADPAVQTEHDNAYNDGYEFYWKAPPTVDVTKDATPSAGGPKGMSACDYGASRGRSSGFAAADDGLSGDDVTSTIASNLASDGSKKRQAESGNPADYRRCYDSAFRSAWAARLASTAAKDVLPDFTAGFGIAGFSDFGSDVGWNSMNGIPPVTVGRLGPRRMFWQGGQKIRAAVCRKCEKTQSEPEHVAG